VPAAPVTSEKAAGRGLAAWVIEILVWALLMWGAWLLSLSAVGVPDLVVGGLSALACGVAAAGVRRAIGQRWRPEWSLVGPLAVLPVAIVVDAAAVLLSPWRPRNRREVVETVDVGGAGRSPRQAARRAVITAVVSASPATVVIDADDETGAIVVHALRSPGPSLQRRYARR
jgi:multisubunit Na+/H+ antiporter MnhE subunit